MWLYITTICVLLIIILLIMRSLEPFVAPMGAPIIYGPLARKFMNAHKRKKYGGRLSPKKM